MGNKNYVYLLRAVSEHDDKCVTILCDPKSERELELMHGQFVDHVARDHGMESFTLIDMCVEIPGTRSEARKKSSKLLEHTHDEIQSRFDGRVYD